jgi:succinate dehydrogenase / fumarate reductase cytochrome b subunit
VKLLFFLKFCKKNILRTNKAQNFLLKMQSKRPLSPHLSIHKYVLTAVLSIFHRFTGIALSVGAILLTIWICLIALGQDYFSIFQFISSFFIFKLLLFLWTLAIFYHLFNGIRYLFWSYGKLMQLGVVYKSGYAVIFLSILSTILVWLSV